MKICAIVVTYNRLTLLKDCIKALLEQTHPINEIIVVNNDSTDGTKEWLDENSAQLKVIHQGNLGGAGGFYTGVKYAYNQNYDWMWLMDDDVQPTQDCLENLLKYDSEEIGILQPIRKFENKYVIFECRYLDLINARKELHQNFIDEKDIGTEPIDIKTVPFEGPLIKKEVIDKIGFPNKDYFIFYDDTDFSYRTSLVSKTIKLIPKAVLLKKLLPKHDCESLSWRKKYEIRNCTYFDRVYGENYRVKFLRPLIRTTRYIKYCINHCQDFTIFKGLKMYKYTFDGLWGKMGKY